MRAARFHDYGTTDVLVVEEAPEPHAGAGEVRIRTAAASVNPIDWKVRSGAAKGMLDVEFPAIPGRDAAGIVDEVGDGVTGVSVGDEVFGLGGVFGASAEFAVLSAWAPVPAGWTTAQAGAAGLVYVTAARGLDALGDLDGRTLLVEGAAGGVGNAAVEIAVARGATVIGTASEPKHEFLAGLGALPTTYGEGLAERVAKLAPGGVDVVLDTAASGSLADLVAIAGSAERVVTVADFVNAPALGVRIVSAENDSAILGQASELGGRGAYTPHVAEEFPLDRIAEAHALAEQGRTTGKIVIKV